MKCHYTVVEGERILITGCTGVAIYQDMDYCTCNSSGTKSTEERICDLENEVKELKNIIKQITKDN